MYRLAIKLILIFFFSILIASTTIAQCIIQNSNGMPSQALHDELYYLLNSTPLCPKNIIDLEEITLQHGYSFSTYSVANRGIRNPLKGSFSFFETIEGFNGETKIFLGHFTQKITNIIELDQRPTFDNLLIEAIAFDEQKGLYNFYELRGTGHDAQWFYRGDSQDALLDNQYLHRDPPPNELKFGERMRCSACHNIGGPILKELAPFNDWQVSNRPLIIPPNTPSDEVRRRFSRVKDADGLFHKVLLGTEKLFHSSAYLEVFENRTWQEILRPLFCTTEINLASSNEILETNATSFYIPPEFLLHPLLGSPKVEIARELYVEMLLENGLRFPETQEIDADHMWLTPVVSLQDIAAIKVLIEEQFISEKIAKDILMFDFKRPIFSAKRCQLLHHVPNSSDDWLRDFLQNLSMLIDEDIDELLNLINNADSLALYEVIIAEYMTSLDDEAAYHALFINLLSSRREVFLNEISRNPLGQILEPGFRVIFPAGA